MKAKDDPYDFDKETTDGRSIKIFEYDEKSPKKVPPFWEDPVFWIILIIKLVLFSILIFHFTEIAFLITIIAGPIVVWYEIVNFIFRR